MIQPTVKYCCAIARKTVEKAAYNNILPEFTKRDMSLRRRYLYGVSSLTMHTIIENIRNNTVKIMRKDRMIGWGGGWSGGGQRAAIFPPIPARWRPRSGAFGCPQPP